MGPLDGIRVIDFGQYVAGPMVAMMLADQGAEVIRVDPPGGPLMSSPANATLNRGKRSIALDLKNPTDRDLAETLIGSADVLIENFRPGVMERLGVGPDRMTAANPGLIYCSLPGFASDDPRAGVAAWEGVVGAATGIYFRGYMPPEREQATNQKSDEPRYTAIPLPSIFGAEQASLAIAAALCVKESTGLGQRIEVPLFDSMFVVLATAAMRVPLPGSSQSPMDALAADAAGGREPVLVSPHHLCADGRWIDATFTAYMGHPELIRSFLEAAGVADWLGELVNPETFEWEKGAPEALDALFLTRSADEWEDLINGVGLTATVCRTTKEWISHPAAKASDLVVEVDDPALGKMDQPGPAVCSSEERLVPHPARPLDADRAEVIAEVGRHKTPASPHSAASPLRHALAGVRVLDITHMLSGPQCGMALAELGADVIAISGPTRRGAGPTGERGKRSLVLDLKTTKGLELFWRLLDDADVVLTNFRPAKFGELGIGPEQIHERRPDIIYCSISAYDSVGPWAQRTGFEFNGQAGTGIQARFGGDQKPETQPVTMNDNGSGLLAAFGIAMALLRRRRTGQGTHVFTSLTRVAGLAQTLYMQDYQGKQWDEPSGLSLGHGPLQQIYRAADGYFYLGAKDAGSLEKVDGLSGVATTAASELEEYLEASFAEDTVARWVERLTAAGVGAHRLVKFAEIADDPWVVAHGLTSISPASVAGETRLMRFMGPGARLSRTPLRHDLKPPQTGEHTRTVLREIGVSSEDIDQLAKDGVVRELVTEPG